MSQILRALSGFVGILIIGALAMYVLKPLYTSADRPVSVAEQWADGLVQLGLRPLYPPTEDFHVGDIWAVVLLGGSARTDGTAPLLSRAVRLGHVQMREQILEDSRRRPRFAATSANQSERSDINRLLIEEREDDQAPIPLASVVFPATTSRRTVDATIQGNWFSRVFSGSRQVTVVQEIRLSKAAGYGVSGETAAIAFARWCRSEPSRCSRAHALRMLEYSLGEITGDADELRIAFVFVSYVFLARSIERVIRLERSNGANLEMPFGPSGAVQNGGASATARLENTVKNEILASEAFPRPLAVGFRAVSFEVIAN